MTVDRRAKKIQFRDCLQIPECFRALPAAAWARASSGPFIGLPQDRTNYVDLKEPFRKYALFQVRTAQHCQVQVESSDRLLGFVVSLLAVIHSARSGSLRHEQVRAVKARAHHASGSRVWYGWLAPTLPAPVGHGTRKCSEHQWWWLHNSGSALGTLKLAQGPSTSIGQAEQ